MSNLWEQAKNTARQDGKANDWAHVVQIYKSLGGSGNVVIFQDKKGTGEILGTSAGGVLIKGANGVERIIDYADFKAGKKIFKSVDRSKLVPIKKLVQPQDGKKAPYWQTFYVSQEEADEFYSKQKKEDEPVVKDKTEDYKTKVAELTVDVAQAWNLMCYKNYHTPNLGALAVREALQNSRDAIMLAIEKGQINRGRVDVSWNEEGELTLTDNGVGMNPEILHTKFLALGGTTKGGGQTAGTAGGFGVAKAVILGCAKSWDIETQDNFLSSSALGKEAISSREYRQGTKLTLRDVQVGTRYNSETGTMNPILLQEDKFSSFEKAVKEYFMTSDVDIDLFINGEQVEKEIVVGPSTFKAPKLFGIDPDLCAESGMEIHIVPHKTPRLPSLYVRLAGLTQFKEYPGSLEVDADIIIDFNNAGDPQDERYPFALSREALKNSYREVVQKITSSLAKNPLALTADTKYRETIVDNVGGAKKRDNSDILNPTLLKELLGKVDILKRTLPDTPVEAVPSTYQTHVTPQFVDDGIQAVNQGSDVPMTPSLATKIQEYAQIQAKYQADGGSGRRPDEAVTLEENPLQYAWLVLEEKGREEGNYNPYENLDVISTWDSILREILKQYTGSKSDLDIYPGIILEKDVLGMCYSKFLDNLGDYRTYVMLNPEAVNTSSDIALASSLKDIACHELSHSLCHSLEQHGETFSYTREQLSLDSPEILDKLVKIVKETKLRTKLDKAKKESQARMEKERIKETMQYYIQNFESKKAVITKLPHYEHYKEVFKQALINKIASISHKQYQSYGLLDGAEEGQSIIGQTCYLMNDSYEYIDKTGNTFTVRGVQNIRDESGKMRKYVALSEYANNDGALIMVPLEDVVGASIVDIATDAIGGYTEWNNTAEGVTDTYRKNRNVDAGDPNIWHSDATSMPLLDAYKEIKEAKKVPMHKLFKQSEPYVTQRIKEKIALGEYDGYDGNMLVTLAIRDVGNIWSDLDNIAGRPGWVSFLADEYAIRDYIENYDERLLAKKDRDRVIDNMIKLVKSSLKAKKKEKKASKKSPTPVISSVSNEDIIKQLDDYKKEIASARKKMLSYPEGSAEYIAHKKEFFAMQNKRKALKKKLK